MWVERKKMVDYAKASRALRDDHGGELWKEELKPRINREIKYRQDRA